MASFIFSPFLLHLVMIALMFLTAASARPFDSGLYGEESSCLMPCRSQNWENSVLNCGPPSVLIAVGHPTSVNQSDSCPTTVAVSVRLSSYVQAYPEYLSTRTIHFLPMASNRSVPTSFMGCRADEGCAMLAVGLAWAGLSSLQTLQLSIVCRIEFFMPGQ